MLYADCIETTCDWLHSSRDAFMCSCCRKVAIHSRLNFVLRLLLLNLAALEPMRALLQCFAVSGVFLLKLRGYNVTLLVRLQPMYTLRSY